MQTIMIKGRLPSLNEYINAERKNRQIAAKMKRETDDMICWQIGRMKPVKQKIHIRFVWYEETARRDPDNVAFAKKFILDAMQKAGKLPNDNAKWIAGFADDFSYGGVQGVSIQITEV